MHWHPCGGARETSDTGPRDMNMMARGAAGDAYTLGDGYVELWEGDFPPVFYAPMLKRGGMRPS